MFTIELNKTYGIGDFKEDLKRLYYQTGVRDQPTSFLFNDTQIVNEMFLEIINNILSTGEVPQLYKEEEFDEVRIPNKCWKKKQFCIDIFRLKNNYCPLLKRKVFQKQQMIFIRFS